MGFAWGPVHSKGKDVAGLEADELSPLAVAEV
jgi:hypothetical protein